MRRISELSALFLSGTAIVVASSTIACAQVVERQIYDMPAQPLSQSIKALAAATRRSILAPTSLLGEHQAPALRGRYSVDEALDVLLAGSGLRAKRSGSVIIIEADGRAASGATADAQDEITVTGSRIRGAPVASPVIQVTRDDARNAGQASLGEIVRSIPQSFGGGQNPGIGFNVPSINGVDVGGGSSINLRGLGSDATLTLLNGHRVAYSGSRQSVDVSTIPLGALDRIEIVADGASALYGSDAVGGVANIILRRDMQGLETRARVGGSTEGGNFQQQYSATGGARWDSGGFIAAYDFNRATAIDARDRDYAAVRARGLRLLPSSRNHNALVSAHQNLTDTLEFTIDGLFNQRHTLLIYPQNDEGDLQASRSEQPIKATAFALAPALNLTLGEGTHIGLSGSYAKDRVEYRNDYFSPGLNMTLTAGCYCNRTGAIDLSGDSRLFRLPGGWAKAAIGIGYRNTFLRNDRGANYPLNFERSQANAFAYGELNLPLVSPTTGIAGVSRLNVSAALRYEHYDDFGSVGTPKLGLVYAPIAALDLKASWGRSFRAPTLLQRYQPPLATLYDAADLGGTGYPASATALYVQGGQAGLKPETASSWSVSAALHPASLPGFSLEFSYFSTRYTNRIVAPIGFTSQALSRTDYATQVTLSPSAALLAATLARAALFSNASSGSYDPANVVAYVDNSNVNAGSQPVHGLDAIASYRSELGPNDSLALTGNASYLVSRRQISSDQPDLPLAGTLYNPPHWRGRAGVSWRHGDVTLTGNANYLGELSDPRSTPAVRIPSQTTFDFTVRYRTPDDAVGLLRGVDLSLSALNLFDAAPPLIATSSVIDTPYDSTNYSAIGRFVSFTIGKKW